VELVNNALIGVPVCRFEFRELAVIAVHPGVQADWLHAAGLLELDVDEDDGRVLSRRAGRGYGVALDGPAPVVQSRIVGRGRDLRVVGAYRDSLCAARPP
jgi:hypothetical protein